MEFDIVVATRNRQLALPLSVPLMLSQNRLPRRFIVVDASDNHMEVRTILERIISDSNVNVDLQIINSAAGSSLQRNIGLKYVQSPVVLFPDDDALWFDNVAESLLRIYENDKDNTIGAVCATESTVPPKGLIDNKQPKYHMEFRDRIQHLIGNFERVFEDRLFPDPFFIDNYPAIKEKDLQNWLSNEDGVLSGPMTGFRMSFRTDIIKRLKFDEALGRYALFEDRDASLNVLHDYLIVRAKKAKVFHYRVPEKRVDGIEWGMMHVLNRAYVICKHHGPGSLARRQLKKYSYYKLVRYLMQAQTHYGFQRVVGAWRALSKVSVLLDTPKEELSQKYEELRSACLK